ncbi:MAG: hypothetical protein QOE71_136, partial [Pseudonocardiales bacterium]|nr:hypothetical protein [Pseudonocardiales bacterium]
MSVRTQISSVRLHSGVFATAVVGVGVLVVLAGCGKADTNSGAHLSDSAPKVEKKILWLGDSVAEVESHPLKAAMEANGVTFENAATDGGGNIVEGDINSPDRLVKGVSTIAKETWK